MRSGTIAWGAPWSRSTPSITIVSVPSPAIRAPIALSRSARSTTSGSRAALRQPRRAAGERRGEHHVLGAGHRDRLEHDLGAREARGPGLDVAVLERDLGAQLPKGGEVQVDRPHADGAPARQRHANGAARASSGPSTSTEARIVLTRSYGASADPIVRASMVARSGRPPRPRRRPDVPQQLLHRADVAHVGHVRERDRLGGQTAPRPGRGAPRSSRPRSRPRPRGGSVLR